MLKCLSKFFIFFGVLFLKDFLDKIFKKYGLDFYGFCDFSSLENELFECRAKQRIPEGANTVITVLFPYKVREEKPENISRYAAVEDYHFVCGKILDEITKMLKNKFKNRAFEYFIDNSPINEVKAAALCGLGVIGKNNLLINERYGSFCFIGEIVTDYKIQSVNNLITNCINCNKCLNACPTGFLSDKNIKCLSSVTQQKGELTDEEKLLVKKGGSIWGCDICQNICPMNKFAEATKIKEFIESYRIEYIENEDIKNRAYAWRGEKVILRNAKIVEKKGIE